jgi:hypothetical protein
MEKYLFVTSLISLAVLKYFPMSFKTFIDQFTFAIDHIICSDSSSLQSNMPP